VIISPDGYIVTNNHVISGSAKVRVILNDKSEYDAEVLATDPNTDLAVLKINARALPAINFADSDGTRIGQWVLAVGNPFNLTSTVTAGIVSAKARNIGILRSELTSRYGVDYSIESFIQTDAAVNPGNSGGALVNLQGELIGINTAIATETGSYAGYSFAIPSNLVNKVVQDLIQYGTVQRGFIGVNIRDMTAGLADQYKLSLLQGALVTGLTPNGAAAEAGVQVGDLIVGVQARRIVSASELQEAVANFKPGDRVILKVMRKTDELNIEVTLLNLKGNTSLLTQKRTSIQDFGVIFTEPNNLELAKKQLDWGVKVSRVDESGLFDKAGVPVGFIITHVNKMPVKDIDELTLTLTRAELYAELNGILPNGKRKTFKIKIP
jgi:Do/DeqQ family serine protease